VEFEQLYNTYYMQVYSYLVTISKDKNLAEEITQKTFFKVFTSSNKHRGEASELTWLCTIAKNLYIDEQRRHRHFKQTTHEVEGTDHPTSDLLHQQEKEFSKAFAEEEAFAIHQVIHNLEEPYKEIFQLRVFGELSFAKIGMLFDKSENWARVTYHRGRIKIQERMNNR